MFECLSIVSFDGDCLLAWPASSKIDSEPFVARNELLQTTKNSSITDTFGGNYTMTTEYRQLRILLKCYESTPPTFSENFSYMLCQALEKALHKPLSPNTVQLNRALIFTVVEQIFDTKALFAYEPNMWSSIGAKNTIVKRILDAVSSSNQQLDSDIWPVPWRAPQVKYHNEELFVDMVEHLTMMCTPVETSSGAGTVTRSSQCSFFRLLGTVSLTTRLSGSPTVQLDLMLPDSSESLSSLHPGADLKLWNSQGLLSFIPPDGNAEILKYSLPKSKCNAEWFTAELRRVPESEYTEIYLSTAIDKEAESIEGLVVDLICPPGTTVYKELRNSAGSLENLFPQKLSWVLPNTVPLGWSATLRVQLENAVEANVQPFYASIRFTSTGKSLSQIKLKSVNIVNWKDGKRARPYKGVRQQLKTTSFILR